MTTASSRTTVSNPTTAVLTMRLLSEITLVASAAWAAAAHTRSVVGAIALGIGAALVIAGVWGVWIAPASRRRLPDPMRLVLELLLFAAAVAGLLLVGDAVPAAVLAMAGGGTAVGVRLLRSGAPEPDTTETETTEPDTTEPLRRPRGRDRARHRQ